MARLRLLLVDDDAEFRRHFEVLAGDDIVVHPAGSSEEALECLRRWPIDAVLLDVDLQEERTGVDLLREIRRREPDLPVIMVSGDDRPETIVAAMQAGAQDYVPKHADIAVVKLKIERRLEDVAWRGHARAMQAGNQRIVGSGPAITALRDEIARVAKRSVRVLIRGESGTGKELVAEAIHAESDRARQRLVRVNGSRGSDEMFEAHLFGHERGAFTGADRRRSGCLEIAAGGTLFLDEVGKMSLGRQAKLLRVIEDASFERIGGNEPIDVAFRLVTASNEDLEVAMEEGRFAQDFYYRIREYELQVPALRERLEDIPVLVRELLDRFAASECMERVGVPDGVVDVLAEHPWPGNVRELDSVLKKAVVLGGGPVLERAAVLTALGTPATVPVGVAAGGARGTARSYRAARDDFDRKFILHALDEAGGDVAETASRIGMSRASLYRRLKDLRISR